MCCKKNDLSRRTFSKIAGGTALSISSSGLGTMGCEKKSTAPEEAPAPASTSAVLGEIDLTKGFYEPLNKVGGSQFVSLSNITYQAIVHKVTETEWAAFSAECTHQSCVVQLPVNGVAKCFCHGSTFGGRGELLGGPAQSGLLRYDVMKEGDKLFITE